MKKLLIVESPAKIKTISKFLGKDFKIMSTIGHIKDLPKNKLGITIDKTIELEYVPMEDKDKVIADICKEASKCDEIYLGTDPDREGEIIAWHIGQEIKKVAKKKAVIYRITYNEITKTAILEAIEQHGDIDENKVAAQQARRVLDRWVGYEVSPILWRKIARGTSAGRVQSVALRLICEREEAVRQFKPEEYWSIHGLFEQNKAKLSAELTHIGKEKLDVKNEQQAQEILKKLKNSSFIVDSITDKQRIKNPLAPFMTSTLQQAAFNRLGFPVKKTMQIAQKLYEGMPLQDDSTPVALITYMRTDSLRTADSALQQIRSFVGKNFSKEYLPSKANIYSKSSGKAQDAHEAIRPIDVSITPEVAYKYLPKDSARLYELIWQRSVASQMQPAKYAQRHVVITGDKFIFKVTGSTLIFDGFLKVYGIDKDEQEETTVIPKTLKEKDPITLASIEPKQHFTQPPPRYSEASLVKELEKEGIGRPSTYSSILSTIQMRNYTTLDQKKRFTPTELGMAITKLLVDNLPDIMNVKFTAHMEENLDKIAHGELERDELLRKFHKAFEKDLKEFKGSDSGKGKTTATAIEITCPKCKKHKLAIRFGKTGEFLGCLGYPECSFTSNFKRDEEGNIHLTKLEEPQLLDEKCPLCGKPLRKVIGKFGPFVACSGYPDCKYIKETKASFKCPLDGGDVVERRWRGGRFWGCKNYPKCKFAVFGEIEETPCPQCKLPFLVKKVAKNGTITLMCSDKKCGFTEIKKPTE